MTGRFELREREIGSDLFELRVEVAGKLRSWSIPYGPSMNPAVKRTGISAAESLDFGRTNIRDQGEFISVLDFQRSWEKGWIVFTLEGKRLKGQFMLERSGRNYFNWSLYKLNDEFAHDGGETQAAEDGDEDNWSSLPLFAATATSFGLVR